MGLDPDGLLQPNQLLGLPFVEYVEAKGEGIAEEDLPESRTDDSPYMAAAVSSERSPPAASNQIQSQVAEDGDPSG